MANNTESVDTRYIGSEVLQQRKYYESQRKKYERRWYDNYFFDDGFHFRFVDRTTGRVVDLTNGSFGVPQRAIPKASKQIRGIANLLTQPMYQPVVYPQKLPPISDEQIKMRMEKDAKDTAKKIGWWLEVEWKEQQLRQKLIQMLILSAKCGISYLQVWPDAVEEEIRTDVYDAFDVFHMGEIDSIYKSPSIIKAVPILIDEIVANEDFDEEARSMVIPDSKYSASQIKNAYESARLSRMGESDDTQTSLVSEAYIREYLNDENWDKAKKDLEDTNYLDGKSKGDSCIRQVFEANSVTLKDKYTNLPDYPFAEFRFEPGPVYQTALIERFIPQNKSLDLVMSRIEHWIGTQAIGAWIERDGENFEISNIPGGQRIKYKAVPPTQVQVPPLPNTLWNYINELSNLISEQGVSASTGGDLPSGVKSGVAIEAIKAAEFANLAIATEQLKGTIKIIAEKMMDIADHRYSKARQVDYRKDDEFLDFEVIGGQQLDKRNKINEKAMSEETVNAIPIRNSYKVDIEVQSGLGFTMEGKINRIQQVGDFMRSLAAEGYLTQDQVQRFLQKFLEIFQYGSTAEFFDDAEGVTPFTVKQIEMIKVAFASVVNDMQKANESNQAPQDPNLPQEPPTPQQETEDEDILKVKTGILSVMKDMKDAQTQT